MPPLQKTEIGEQSAKRHPPRCHVKQRSFGALKRHPLRRHVKQRSFGALKRRPRKPPRCHIERRSFGAFMNDLAPRSVDLILTDPPYTISRKTGFKSVKHGVKRFAVDMDFGKWDNKQIDLDLLATSMFRVLRTGGTAIVWYDIWKLSHLSEAMAAAGFKMLRVLIWQKTNPVPLNMRATYLSNSREIAVAGVKGGAPTFYGSYDHGVYAYPIPRHNGRRTHPTQKPLDLFVELIKKHSDQGDMVIDPFLGSGTTAMAAMKTGRKFAGCDIDGKYVKAAKERVKSVKGNFC